MGLRDFVDEQGTSWRVWDVAMERAHRDSPANAYLGQYQDGWLCFESATERRRLAHFPEDWLALSEAQLARLLDEALLVPRRRTPLDVDRQDGAR